jgi:hypothetical protein
VFVPVEAMPAELPRDLQNSVVVSPVVRLVFSPTPAVNSADGSNLKKNYLPFFNLYYKNIMMRNSKSLLQQTEP